MIFAPALDPAITPFSRYGSYLSLRRLETAKWSPLGTGLYVRSHHGRTHGAREMFRLDLLDNGRQTKAATSFVPEELRIEAARGKCVRVAFDGTETLRFRGAGVGLRLQAPPGGGVVAMPQPGGRVQIIHWPQHARSMLSCLRGTLKVSAPWGVGSCKHIVIKVLPDANGVCELALDTFVSSWVPRDRPAFTTCVATARREFADWLRRQPPAPEHLRAARAHAACINWSAVVRAEGLLTRDAMYMSKNHMDNVWSWDHCFNAMALARRLPAFALDQWMLMPDQQDAFGCFPDAVNDRFRHFCYSKPPVHGWALDFMRRENPRYFTPRRLADTYVPLCRWSRWWMTHRRWPGDPLPYYLHGNDSGWDNSTMFDRGTPLVAPDLGAFLALQFGVLGDLATLLRKPGEAKQWRATSDRMVKALVKTLWRGDRFVAIRRPGGEEVECRSLVPCMPIVLGRRLPAKIQEELVRNIRAFLTPWGLATEQTHSDRYASDGYWRGPIWAPSTMLVVSGLEAVGEHRLARTIATRFCRMCAKSGFAENFDALTGAPLRDPAYTWTASVFLLLAERLCRPVRQLERDRESVGSGQ
jgi:glycogen debranching enzyme